MKRTLSLALALSTLLVLAGCGGAKKSAVQQGPTLDAGVENIAAVRSDGTVTKTHSFLKYLYYGDGVRNDDVKNQDVESRDVVKNWTDIVAVSVGYDYTVGLRSDGTVVAAGNNHYGQCDVGDWTDIKLP